MIGKVRRTRKNFETELNKRNMIEEINTGNSI